MHPPGDRDEKPGINVSILPQRGIEIVDELLRLGEARTRAGSCLRAGLLATCRSRQVRLAGAAFRCLNLPLRLMWLSSGRAGSLVTAVRRGRVRRGLTAC